jgi:hypothetical protein
VPARLNETLSSAAITTVESLVVVARRKQVLAVSLLLAGIIVSLLAKSPGRLRPELHEDRPDWIFRSCRENPLGMRRANSASSSGYRLRGGTALT